MAKTALAILLSEASGESTTPETAKSWRDEFVSAALAFFCGIFLSGAVTSSAAEISKEDAAAIRAAISEQLDAFARDDAPRAFSLATAGIRAQFGTPEAFMEMVRSEYAVVYRPKSVQFEPPEFVEGQVVQPVRMTDAAGRQWLAIYPMLREADGRWRTNGCLLQRLQGLQTRGRSREAA